MKTYHNFQNSKLQNVYDVRCLTQESPCLHVIDVYWMVRNLSHPVIKEIYRESKTGGISQLNND